MVYKKIFFPIGGGDELEERLYGAFLIAKYFNVNLEVLQSYFQTSKGIADEFIFPKEIHDSIDDILKNKLENEKKEFLALVEKVKNDLSIKEDENLKISIKLKEGIRSSMIELYSKISDLVIVANPPSGIPTATFEAIVQKTGKSVIMFPRIMRKFSVDSILVGWNNSPEASRALTSSIELLKVAKRVEIIIAKEYIKYDSLLDDMLEYLKMHGIIATIKIVNTTMIPGETLLSHATNGSFDLIVAGASSHKGFRELMLGGTTRYLLENANIPIFLSQ
ncbi:UspA domain protein [Arcobacter nitrofigilis DSM 7299]|uniref:UspA domain protein n=1 Tax=Arcobacter nitrofigilis (strain ATCC 33309 / DSM 7299 / CCUG 15893 / LMG 7604 / NCTC 12251 / CI) TaxID=572480 RepID=D5V3B4_ARCNC|nr:universal stress protein [Arcobacter nitrofigilis]ADG92696.1 UspA domain protein [Arcobacter nitrofigilis DSM 7299]